MLISAPENVEERNFIRSTWGRPEYQIKYNFQIVFMVGQSSKQENFTPKDQKILDSLQAEHGRKLAEEQILIDERIKSTDNYKTASIMHSTG